MERVTVGVSEKPKVLIVDFITTFGGVQRVMANMIPELLHYVDVAYIDALEDDGSCAILEQVGVPRTRLPVWPRRQALGFDRSFFHRLIALAAWGPAYLIYAFRLALYARRHGFEAVYTNSKKGLMVCAVAGFLARLPVVYHCHGLNGPEDVGTAYRAAMRGCRAVIAVSQDVRRKLLSAGLPDRLVHVVYNGVDVRELQAASERGAGTSIPETLAAVPSPKCLVACNLQEGKGVHVAIEAVYILRERGCRVHLLIAGDIPRGGDFHYREQLQSMVQDLGLQDQVHLLGWRSDLPAVMKSCDVLLVPSLAEESFGMVAAEAMALGKPVVASRIGGLPEIVQDGQTGFLFGPGDAEELADRIWQLVSDTAVYEQFSRQAQNWAGSRFTVRRQSVEVAGVIEDVVTGTAARSS